MTHKTSPPISTRCAESSVLDQKFVRFRLGSSLRAEGEAIPGRRCAVPLGLLPRVRGDRCAPRNDELRIQDTSAKLSRLRRALLNVCLLFALSIALLPRLGAAEAPA